MSEPEFNIDEAEAAYNEARGESGGADDGAIDDGAASATPGEGETDETPPGFLPYDEYVAQGGDPDMYRGRKAYEAEHGRINENKALRADIRGMKESSRQMLDVVSTFTEQESARIRAEIESELHEAYENEDPKAAVAAQKKLDKHDQSAPAEAAPAEHPDIQAFRTENPMLDVNSDEFNQEFNDDVEAYFNSQSAQLTQNHKRPLTDGQRKRLLKRALKEARDLHEIEPEPTTPAVSERNQRRGAGGGRRRAAPQTPTAKAENFQVKNPRNPSQANAATDVRDMIEKKYGKDAAKQFETGLFNE